jgi:transposase-like protein
MESVRWPDGPTCPHCGTVNEAVAITTRPGLYRCIACGVQFTVTVGTALEGTHLPLSVWYLAMYLMLSTAKPISAMSLSRQLDIQYRTCWHLLHRLRAMLAAGEKLPLTGIIEADETYVGGKAQNLRKHRQRPTRGRGTDKPMIFAAIERGGQARAAVVESASAIALDPLMYRWLDRNSILCTDELAIYDWFGSKMRRHHRVLHSAREYAKTEDGMRVHTNTVEGFFGLFKRGIFGIHHQVSPKHLHRYVVEHTFRKNTAHDAPERIACCLIGRHGRLRLKELFA